MLPSKDAVVSSYNRYVTYARFRGGSEPQAEGICAPRYHRFLESMAFDDLPGIAVSHVQSADSVLALKGVLRLPAFIVRDEHPDYGTDFTVELGVKGAASNFRFQIQLKSEEQGTYVDGGAFVTVRFLTSRISYLARGSGKNLVVVYDRETSRLYYEWVQSVINRLDTGGMLWRDQETVTVRVPTNQQLVDNTAVAIHAEVLRYCQSQLTLQSRTVEAMPTASRKAAEDLTSSKDVDSVLELLSSSGLALVTSDLGQEILAVLDTVPAVRWTASPKLLLVRAFAHFHVGAPLAALHYANLVGKNPYGFTDEETALLVYVRAASGFSVGQVELDAYFECLRTIANVYPATAVGLQAAAEALHRELVARQRDVDQWLVAEKVLARAYALRQSFAALGDSERARWSFDLLVAEVECEAGISVTIEGVLEQRMAEQLDRLLPHAKRVESAARTIELLRRASERAEAVYKAAREKEAHALEAQALFTLVRGHLRSLDIMAAISPVAEALERSPKGQEHLEDLSRGARQAHALFSAMGNRLMAFRSEMLVAEIANLAGNAETRDNLMTHLRKEAEMIGLRPEAAQLVSAHRPTSPAAPPGEDPLSWIRMDPEQAERFARRLQHVLQLPDDRRPNILCEIESRKVVSRAKVDWCRHIELLQNLTHQASPTTHYTRPPSVVGVCKRYSYRSQIEHEDFSAVIETFKRTYCASCTGREVWRDATDPSNRGRASG